MSHSGFITSSPIGATQAAPAFTPANASTSRSRGPDQTAWPIPPRVHGTSSPSLSRAMEIPSSFSKSVR